MSLGTEEMADALDQLEAYVGEGHPEVHPILKRLEVIRQSLESVDDDGYKAYNALEERCTAMSAALENARVYLEGQRSIWDRPVTDVSRRAYIDALHEIDGALEVRQ